MQKYYYIYYLRIFSSRFFAKKERRYRKRISKIFFLETNRNLTQKLIEDLSLQADTRFSRSLRPLFPLSFPLLFALYLETDTNAYVKLVRPLRERYVDVGVTKLSATPGKNTCRLRNTHCGLMRDWTRKRERKWQSSAGITLRFLPHCVLRRRSFRRASCPRLVGGNIEKVATLSPLPLSLSLFSSLFAVFVFPPDVSSSRLITARRIRTAKATQLPNTQRGILRTTHRENERSNNSFCSLCRQPRLLSARWFTRTRNEATLFKNKFCQCPNVLLRKKM